MIKSISESKIAIVGLGYVGLPLAAAFAEKLQTIGYDIDSKRVLELQNGHDRTLEIEDNELANVLVESVDKLQSEKRGLLVTDEIINITTCNIFIVTVPTPTDKHNRPVLTPMLKASGMIGKILKT